VIVLGSGSAGCTVASACREAGQRVALVEAREFGGTCPLRGCDPKKVLIRAAEVVSRSADQEGKGIEAVGEINWPALMRFKRTMADLVLHGADRVADIQDLNLHGAGVENSIAGIQVNEFMQSISNPHIYAGGDAAATPYPLTPTAVLHGEIAAHNILSGNSKKVDHRGIPSVVFTIPALAGVGLQEEEIKKRDIRYQKIFEEISQWFSAKSIGLQKAWAKVLLGKDSGLILGAAIIGHNAEEMINIFALAKRLNLTAADLKKVIWAYPTSIS
jgi:glutathione reductase (NADPH)